MHNKPHTEESKAKMREASLRNGNRPPSRLGAKMPIEIVMRRSLELKGKPRKGNPMMWKHTLATRLKMSKTRKGAGSYQWKGGVTSEHARVRKTSWYREWRRHVFQRDDYTCQACGKRGGELQADHELPFAHFPDLRLEILNGRTLCPPCHKLTPTYGWNKEYAKS